MFDNCGFIDDQGREFWKWMTEGQDGFNFWLVSWRWLKYQASPFQNVSIDQSWMAWNFLESHKLKHNFHTLIAQHVADHNRARCDWHGALKSAFTDGNCLIVITRWIGLHLNNFILIHKLIWLSAAGGENENAAFQRRLLSVLHLF